MHDRDYRDLIGAATLIGIGLFVAVYAVATYNLGTIRRMGPGMFPAALGFILFALGIMLLVPALLRRGPRLPKVEVAPLLAILASAAVFAFTIRLFGLFVAVAGMSIVASLASENFSLRRSLVLAAALATVATLIFKVGLDLQVQIVAWPF